MFPSHVPQTLVADKVLSMRVGVPTDKLEYMVFTKKVFAKLLNPITILFGPTAASQFLEFRVPALSGLYVVQIVTAGETTKVVESIAIN